MYALHKSAEIAAHQSFNYALFDDAETAPARLRLP